MSALPKDLFQKRGSKKRKQAEADFPGWQDFDEEDWTNHTGRRVLRYINADLRCEISMTIDDAFPITHTNGVSVYLLCRDILERLWKKSEKEMYSPKEIVTRRLLDGDTPPRAAIRGSAVLGSIMDAVDGGGETKTVLKVGKMCKMRMKDPASMMRWIMEAIVETTEGKEDYKAYMWKHL